MSAPRVGLYLRLSREDEGGRESQSIETQRMLLARFLDARRLEGRGNVCGRRLERASGLTGRVPADAPRR